MQPHVTGGRNGSLGTRPARGHHRDGTSGHQVQRTDDVGQLRVHPKRQIPPGTQADGARRGVEVARLRRRDGEVSGVVAARRQRLHVDTGCRACTGLLRTQQCQGTARRGFHQSDVGARGDAPSRARAAAGSLEDVDRHRTGARVVRRNATVHPVGVVGGTDDRDPTAGSAGSPGLARLRRERLRACAHTQAGGGSPFDGSGRAGVHKHRLHDLRGHEVDPVPRLDGQALALQGLIAHPIAQAGACVVVLRDLAAAGIQGDVLVGTGLRQIGTRHDPVADLDIARGIEQQGPLDCEGRLCRVVDVFDPDARRVDLQRRMERVLVGRLDTAKTHRTLPCHRMTAGRCPQPNERELPGADQIQLLQGQVQFGRIFLAWIADIHPQAQRRRADAESPARRRDRAAADEVHLVSLEFDVAAAHADTPHELDLGGAEDRQIPACDGQTLVEHDVTGRVDRQRPRERHLVLEDDTARQVTGHPFDRQGLQRIAPSDGPPDAHVARGLQRQRVIGRVPIAVERRELVDADDQSPAIDGIGRSDGGRAVDPDVSVVNVTVGFEHGSTEGGLLDDEGVHAPVDHSTIIFSGNAQGVARRQRSAQHSRHKAFALVSGRVTVTMQCSVQRVADFFHQHCDESIVSARRGQQTDIHENGFRTRRADRRVSALRALHLHVIGEDPLRPPSPSLQALYNGFKGQKTL